MYCKTVDRTTVTQVEDVMMRWAQRYMHCVKHVFGLLVELQPRQSRAVQQAVVSRTMFLVVLGPKDPGRIPQRYSDMVVVKISKVDVSDPYVLDPDHIIMREFEAQRRGYQSDPAHDILHGMLVLRFSPTGDPMRVVEATAHNMVFNSISRSRAALPSCGVGYPGGLTVGAVYRMLLAHILDDRT